ILNCKLIKTIDSGAKAWRLLKQKKRIDCVVCFYDMKNMSGLTLLKFVRREVYIGNIPFFLVDETSNKVKVLEALQAGVSGLFLLPLDLESVRDKILEALSKKRPPVIKRAEREFNRGVEFLKIQKYNKALNVFTNLVSQKENPEIYFNIGYIKTVQGKYEEAIEAFSKATQLDRLFGRAYEEIGKIYKILGDEKKSEQYLQQAAEVYMDTGQLGPAEEVLNGLLKAGTDSLNVFNTLGVIYRKKGETDIALTQYKRALKVHPEEPYIYYNIGRLYLDMKDPNKAKEYFSRALDKDRNFNEARQVIKAIDLGIV
ncbi:MAG: tetratricopeptide repeat protein, partial [Desulfobacteraceae bacterium]|nr:tetratricopeptide repeat protein [Desulfobacteraceae bacterium]